MSRLAARCTGWMFVSVGGVLNRLGLGSGAKGVAALGTQTIGARCKMVSRLADFVQMGLFLSPVMRARLWRHLVEGCRCSRILSKTRRFSAPTFAGLIS